MIYLICDEIDKKVWMIFEAENDRAAKRTMRQNIIKYQKDVDFDFTLRPFHDLKDYKTFPIVANSDELFKVDEKNEEEANE